MRFIEKVRRHPAAAYFLLTFLLSWGAALAAAGGPAGFPADSGELATRLPLVVLGLTSGPIVAGLALTAVCHGRRGLRELAARAGCWRVAPRWYAVALLAAPGASALTLWALSLFLPGYLPGMLTAADKAGVMAGALAAGLAGGLLEEPGWTGFATPALRGRLGVYATGLALGALWGAWHLIAAYWGSGTPEGAFSIWIFLPQLLFYALVLPAYRVLMVRVHEKTGGSLLLVMLMHASLTGSILFLFMPAGLAEGGLSLWYLCLAAVFWLAVGGLALADRKARLDGMTDA
jgi:membrane protease YdiL (CAAX protease family)